MFPLMISSINAIWSNLLNKSLMKNFIFCAAYNSYTRDSNIWSPIPIITIYAGQEKKLNNKIAKDKCLFSIIG